MLVNQNAAQEYVQAIEAQRERVLMEYLLSHAIGFAVRHAVQGNVSEPGSFDLLLYIQCSHQALRKRDVLAAIDSGKYASFADIPEIF